MSVVVSFKSKKASDVFERGMRNIQPELSLRDAAQLFQCKDGSVLSHLKDCPDLLNQATVPSVICTDKSYRVSRLNSTFVHHLGYDFDGSPSYISEVQYWIDDLASIVKRNHGERNISKKIELLAGFDEELYPIKKSSKFEVIDEDSYEDGYCLFFTVVDSSGKEGSRLNAKQATQWVMAFSEFFGVRSLTGQGQEGDHDVDTLYFDSKDERDIFCAITGKGYWMGPENIIVAGESRDWIHRALSQLTCSISNEVDTDNIKPLEYVASIFDYGFCLKLHVDRKKGQLFHFEKSARAIEKIVTESDFFALVKSLFQHLFGAELGCVVRQDQNQYWPKLKKSVSGGEYRSLTDILKANGSPMSAIKANKIMLKLGLLEELSRPSTAQKGVIRKYKSLTESGQSYGLNLVDEERDQTKTMFFDEKFGDLLKLLLGHK